jgi:tRNA (cytidine/uridine-2'-O-)-methyltransferase
MCNEKGATFYSAMFDIALYQPEIPPNTGNIIRLAANTGCRLHLIEPLGFRLNDRQLKRAGLDYADMARVVLHQGWAEFRAALAGRRLYAFSTRATRLYTEAEYNSGDLLLFGPETRGLPESILESVPDVCRLRLPMQPGSRSMNLSNACAVVVYEAWRRIGFSPI